MTASKKYSRELIIAAKQRSKEKSYWLEKLSGLPVKSCFPHRLSAVKGEGIREDKVVLESLKSRFSGRLFSHLLKLGKGDDRALHVILVTGLIGLLNKYTGNTDIVVGTPIYKQDTRGDIDNVVPINTVVALRAQFSDNSTIKDLLTRMGQTVIKAMENYGFPIEMLVDELNLPYHDRENEFPLFEHILLLENIQKKEHIEHINANMVFCFSRTDESIEGVLHYNPRRYEKTLVETVTSQFQNFLEQMTRRIDIPLADMDILSDKEKQRLLFEFNDTRREYSRDKTLHQLFEEQVEQTPDHIAVTGPAQVKYRSYMPHMTYISYGELNRKANRLAGYLRDKGVKPNRVVGLLLETLPDRIIGILGILKAGGAYLPLDTTYPPERILLILRESDVSLLLTASGIIDRYAYTALQDLSARGIEPHVTGLRQQGDFDSFPHPDRSLIDFEKYSRYIGHAMVKKAVSLQGTRGCPYNCAYCHRTMLKKNVARSAENIFDEVMYYYNRGVRRFSFVDEIFNLNRENSTRFFKMVIKNRLKLQLFFPNGMRADRMTKEYVDLMVEAGTVDLGLALETASPRLQKLIKKNLNIDKLREIAEYFCSQYPGVILELFTMHGFPTETEDEAMETLNFIKSLKWVHFPYVFLLKIHPSTDMMKLALDSGISRETIERSMTAAFHEIPETLPFPKRFTRRYVAQFMNDYFLSKKRLTHVLPYQLKIASQDELARKYDNYLPAKIKTFTDIIENAGISREELGQLEFVRPDTDFVPDYDAVREKRYTYSLPYPFTAKPADQAFRVLLLDLSVLFSTEKKDILHGEVTEPLGLMYLLTYLQKTFGSKINGRMYKAQIDFDSYKELKPLVCDFKPHLIGIRTLSYFKDFFHKTAALIKEWGIESAIIAGGPYGTSDYKLVLQDPAVDLTVLREGELTLVELVEKMIANGNKLPGEEVLREIRGIAFLTAEDKKRLKTVSREILCMDKLAGTAARYPGENLHHINRPDDLLYLISTSGSTGKPKSVVLEHRNLNNLLNFQSGHTGLDFSRVLQFASIGFDVSAQEIFSTLLSGGQLYLIDNEIKSDVFRLFDLVERNRINTIFLPPAFLRYIFSEPGYRARFPKSVRDIILAGEQLIITPEIREYVRKNEINLHNHYGPTETHVVTALTLEPTGEPVERPPIGKPISNTRIYILNKHQKLLPIGAAGELYISGDNVGRGYLNNPELTSQKFIFGAHGFNRSYRSHKSYILYRTGDLARWLPDGNIEFLGRIDHQVSLRGFRVELEEIEKQLQTHGEIEKAVVIMKESIRPEQSTMADSADKYLCAFIVGKTKGDEIDEGEMREYLSARLPDYMIPSYFIRLEDIPLTPSGKFDRKVLDGYKIAAVGRGKEREFCAPRSETEKKLARVWSEVLGIERDLIGIDVNFFELGGHSLKATISISKIQRIFNVKIKLVDIFTFPTIRELAGHIGTALEDRYIPIKSAEEKEYYDLSYAQRRLWVICQFEHESSAYNMTGIYLLSGPMNIPAMEQAIKTLVRRHESLRTLFIKVNDEPRQRILKKDTFKLEITDLRVPGLSSREKEEQVGKIYSADANKRFDLEYGPLFKVKLLRLEDEKNLLTFHMHHIINDGWSLGVMYNEIVNLYNFFVSGRTGSPPLLLLKHQYKDYAVWHNRLVEAGRFDTARRYWLEKLKDNPRGIQLPLDHPRKALQTFQGSCFYFIIEAADTSKLHRLKLASSRDRETTVFMKLLTLLDIFLYRYSGQEDIILGAPIAGRKHPELKNIIGFLVNTLVLRTGIDPDGSFKDLLEKNRRETLECYENQDYPFNVLVEKLGLDRDLSQSPLFNVMIAHNNTEILDKTLNLEGIAVRDRSDAGDFNESVFDLIFFMDEVDEHISCKINYNNDLFETGTIERISGNFLTFVKDVLERPDVPVSGLDIMSETEYRRIIREFNSNRRDFPRLTIQELFENRVEKCPHRLAVVYNDDKITYDALNRRANQLANYLRDQYSVQPGDIIGIFMDRCIEMIEVLLGIIKSGAGYVAFDPNYPEDHVLHMLKDSRTQLLITAKTQIPPHWLDNYKGREIDIDEHRDKISRESIKNPPVINDFSDILYVIYTSGSTGTPNGAILTHGILSNLIQWQDKHTSIDGALRCLQFTSINFCVSFQEIMGTLTSGGELYLVGDIERRDIDYLMDFLAERKIEVLYLPFSYLNHLFNESSRWGEDFKHRLKHIITAGEQLKVTSGLKKFLDDNPRVKLHNHYGSSEMHVVTSYTLDFSTSAAHPIPPAGKPIANTAIYILDEHRHPVPVGVWGELCIAGAREVAGYIHNKTLTDKKLLLHPVFSKDGKHLYCSGDIGRWLPDGNIQLRGRKDEQVKIRGFRVEPGEIESKILALTGVKDCVVIVKEADAAGAATSAQKYLMAYVVLSHPGVDIDEIKSHLANVLPQYMIPRFTVLEALPLMPNGKVDREKLPEPGQTLPKKMIADLTHLVEQYCFDGTPAITGITDLDVQLTTGQEETDTKVHEQLARQAAVTPGNIALISARQQGAYLTYRELDEASRQLAAVLKEKGVKPGNTAGLVTEPSIEMVIGALGILKAGGGYAVVDPDLTAAEVTARLEETGAARVLTTTATTARHSFKQLQGIELEPVEPVVTCTRRQIINFDHLPIPDRSLVKYESYGNHIGLAMAKHTITLQATRGCPYNCLYCHKIWPKKHVVRSAENIFKEVLLYYNMGIRRFVFVDDIFNLDVENSRQFFKMVIARGIKVQLYFPNGLRSDLLTKDYIDLMVEAGTVSLGLALETASPRLQTLIKKNMNLEKLRENVEYLCKKYPRVILELFLMHGFPTETEKEALMSLDFLESLHWIDFPYFHILKIYPNSEMADLAIEKGISPQAIAGSANLAFHQLPDTLPFDKSFTLSCQARFLEKYFLLEERLSAKLPYQMKVLTEDELVEKYNSYLPVKIDKFDDLLKFTGIKKDRLEPVTFPNEKDFYPPALDRELMDHFAPNRQEPHGDALRILLLDLSQFFTGQKDILYDGVEPPLGLIYLLTWLNRQLGSRICGKIAKSRVDFDNYKQLKALLAEFKPDVIGIRTLTYYADFFHDTAALIRQWGIQVPIIAGGPYATSDYRTVLQDPNLDLVVLSEGELTFSEVIQRIMENDGTLPGEEVLKNIPGIAFVSRDKNQQRQGKPTRELLLVDELVEMRQNPLPAEAKQEETTVVSILSTGSLSQLSGALTRGGTLFIPPPGPYTKDIRLLEFHKENNTAQIRLSLEKPGIPAADKLLKPGDEVEKPLQDIWAGLLQVEKDQINRESNFFDLGGHSLKATILVSKIHKEFNIKMPLAEIFKTPILKELALYIKKAKKDIYEAIRPVEKKEYYPQSSAQKRLFFLDQFDKIGTTYNMPVVFDLEGKIDRERYKNVFNGLAAGHETLRTSFHIIDGEPVQKVHDKVDFEVEYIDLTTGNTEIGINPEQCRDPGIIHHLVYRFVRPFDLSGAPLLRAGLFKLAAGKYLFLLDTHHIISDGTSDKIMVDDLTRLYDGKEPLPLRIQYKDFSSWQNELLRQRIIKKQEKYWLDIYKWNIPRLELPLDYARPAVMDYLGDTHEFMIPRAEALPIKRLDAGTGSTSTLYIKLLAAFNILLARYTGQDDIVVGTPVAGRPHADLQNIIGMFVNMLAMRNYLHENTTYLQFLESVKENSIKAFENQDFQFEELIDRLELERDTTRNPLFSVDFVLQNMELPEVELKDARITPYHYREKTAKFDISIHAFEKEDGIFFRVMYYKRIFKRETIQQLSRHFATIVKTVGKQPGIRLPEIEFLWQEEKQQLLYDFNCLPRHHASGQELNQLHLNKTTAGLFAEQAEQTPDRVALVFNRAFLTYSRLEENVNRLANFLYREKQVRPDDRVGILMDPGSDFIAAALGILEAGGAFVPIDCSLPAERIKNMIADAGIEVVISSKEYIRVLNRLQWECPSFHTFLCMNSTDIHQETGIEKNELANMKKLWEYVGEKAVDEIAGGGWNNSFTGEPFSREEMDEYGDNILKKLQPLLNKNMRVLEIGCASGITMYRIAPKVGFYYGTDLSTVIIEKNKQRVKEEAHQNIALAALAADQIDTIHEKDFDMVIMNSVIHSFYDLNYLRMVLRKCVGLMKDRGYLFVGDVMDQRLEKNLAAELADFNRANSDKKYRTRTDFSTTLFVHREFFEDLTVEIPACKTVKFSRKIYTIENELTKFRYDVLMEVDKRSMPMGNQKTGMHRPTPHKHKYQLDLRTLTACSVEKVCTKTAAENLAYVIYTSGTSGTPKGVLLTNKNLTNYVRWFTKKADLTPADRALLTSSPAFDLGYTSIFPSILNGIPLHIIPREIYLTTHMFLSYIGKNAISYLKLTPSLFSTIVDHPEFPGSICKDLRLAVLGGEPIDVKDVEKAHSRCPNLQVINHYGPTEATIGCIAQSIDFNGFERYRKKPTIGKPIANTRVYILDNYLTLVPKGVPGELCVSGTCLGRGYLNKPALTAEKFHLRRPGAPRRGGPICCANRLCRSSSVSGLGRDMTNNSLPSSPSSQLPSFSASFFSPPCKNFLLEVSEPGERVYYGSYRSYRSYIYKTGDRARWLGNGNIEFLGRIDRQVKIRGFRIELGEIENRLLKHHEIKEAVITVREGRLGNDICAYVVPRSLQPDTGLPVDELKKSLSLYLPEYMVPSFFVLLENIPLTPNGKVDKKKLPKPGLPEQGEAAPSEAHLKPVGKIEPVLLDIWADLLEIEKSRLNRESHFFELGGHSLKATILMARIHKFFGVKIPLAHVFEYPTIKGIASSIAQFETKKFIHLAKVEKKEYYPLSYNQKRLWFINRLEPHSPAFNMPGWIEMKQKVDEKLIEKTLYKLMARHESFRTGFDTVNDEPVQRVVREVKIPFETLDISSLEKKEKQNKRERIFKEVTETPFDLSRPPIFRSVLVKFDEDHYEFIYSLHHILSDGWSNVVLRHEFYRILEELTKAGPAAPEPLELQYKDFAEWQNKQLGDPAVREKSHRYWREKMEQGLPLLKLRKDGQPIDKKTAGAAYRFTLNREVTDRLKNLASNYKTSIFVVLFSVFTMLLSRLSRQEDVVTGILGAGREHAALHNIVGFFVNTLIAKIHVNGEERYPDFLCQVSENIMEMMQHQGYPLELVFEDLKMRFPDISTLFNMFSLNKWASEQEISEPGAFHIEPFQDAKFEIAVHVTQYKNGFEILCQYMKALFKKERIEYMMQRYLDLLQSIADNHFKTLKEYLFKKKEKKLQIKLN